MHRLTGVVLALAGVAVLGLGVAANEKPTPEFQGLMKSTGAAGQALRGHVTAKDYDAIAKDATTLKENFAKIEAFWTAKKADDAIGFAKTGAKGAADLETAAKAKDDAAITAASRAVNGTCMGCHSAHREQLPDKSYEIK